MNQNKKGTKELEHKIHSPRDGDESKDKEL